MPQAIALHQYIQELLQNQNMTNTPFLQNIYSERDYYNLLHEVLLTIREHPHASLSLLRFQLFQKSGLKELIDSFVKETQLTPGLLLDFGTFKTRETILCGKSQEFVHDENNQLIFAPKNMEQDTIFDLASTSKIFTCISVLKLAEWGFIDLFTPVKNYVPAFTNLDDVTVYDLLKFRVMIVTDYRIDSAKTPEEAQQILYTAHKKENQNFTNAYTDIGAMVLRLLVEKMSGLSFVDFVQENILKPAGMSDTYLNVPEEKLYRVANENYSTIVDKDGNPFIRYDNIPGTSHDPKAQAMGSNQGIAPGHAGYFSTKDDLIRLATSLINHTILSEESVMSISDNEVGYNQDGNFSYFYGSLVYLKQPDPKNIYLPLSGKSFISPGFAGTTLCVDPLNQISLFIGANRLHNRIYQVHPSQRANNHIVESKRKTFTLPTGEVKVVSADFSQERTQLLKLAINLSLQYQFLEQLFPKQKEMHLVRELN